MHILRLNIITQIIRRKKTYFQLSPTYSCYLKCQIEMGMGGEVWEGDNKIIVFKPFQVSNPLSAVCNNDDYNRSTRLLAATTLRYTIIHQAPCSNQSQVYNFPPGRLQLPLSNIQDHSPNNSRPTCEGRGTTCRKL